MMHIKPPGIVLIDLKKNTKPILYYTNLVKYW